MFLTHCFSPEEPEGARSHHFCSVMEPTETAYLMTGILAFTVVIWVFFASKSASWQRQAEAAHTSASAANETSAASIIYRSPFELHRTKHPTPTAVTEALPSMRYAACQPHAAARSHCSVAAEAANIDEERGRVHHKHMLRCSICCCEYFAHDVVKLLPCLHM